VSIVDVPVPVVRRGWVGVVNAYSLISAGTERTKLAMGEKSLLQKARARPDLVKKVIDKARVEGLGPAVGVTRDRLDALAPIGYSSAGIVVEVGESVAGISPGDRVACGGGGWANHAEFVAVPSNLVVPVPENVALDDAAYATVGAIALHGVRQSEAGLGDCVGVIGLGLVGQLAVRLLQASGCRVIGIDLDQSAVELARASGAVALLRNDGGLEESIRAATQGLGLDAVLLCASSPSSDPLELAVALARDRGRIVVVGETRIDVDRATMYEKELELRMSRSYGAGRYDREYEERGRDLPAGYVRWTEQRNMQAFLDLIALGRITPAKLTTHRFTVDAAPQAYRLLTAPERGGRPFGVLLEYSGQASALPPPKNGRKASATTPGVALIGAGAFARAILIPALQSAHAHLVAVTSEGGLTAADVATRFGFERAAGSVDEILEDPKIGAVVIATPHQSHAGLTAAALRAGKAVFVEKPLALSIDQLQEIESALSPDSLLMVGFNRRFAPLVERLQAELGSLDDLVLSIRVNAGPLEHDHWLHDPEDGGGRLLGEGCHFVDLLATLAGSLPIAVHGFAVPQPGRPIDCSDSFSAHIRFERAIATLVYSGGGDPKLPKERLEAFGGGVAATLDDFRELTVVRAGKRQVWKSPHDKGHRAEIAAFIAAVHGTSQPPPVDSYFASTRLTLALGTSLRSGMPVDMRRPTNEFEEAAPGVERAAI
jgi:predicted dehydrogenase/threonine dehydrogenase-like Zn-dependent dehydrogenase